MGRLSENMVFESSIPKEADVTIAVVYAVFGFCSLLGNSTLLYVSYKKKRWLKPAEFFIINLAVSDMGLTLSLYPLAIISSFSHRWLFGRMVCLMYAFCGVLFGICSLTTLTLLSLVCFVKVCYPLYGNRFTAAHGRLLLVCAWTYALVFACSPLVHWGEYGPEPYGTACCIDWLSSNQRSGARSYMVALFVLCYLLPCVLILVSYTSILLTLRRSRRTMEQHIPPPTRLSNIHTIIVKLSVAICIGFFAAWSPYAVVSMWAAFGQIKSIPPLAFAMPAMFAKSSTIYNPIVYLLLRPNFRRVAWRDLGLLRRAFLRHCFCSRILQRPCRPETLRTLRKRSCRPNSVHGELPGCGAKGRVCEKCSDAFECFRRYPKACQLETMDTGTTSLKCPLAGAVKPLPTELKKQQKSTKKKPFRVRILGKRKSEIEHFRISLETMPGHAKVAW
ncbi:opsin-5-like [Astyanax mexicanus]|uniref:opsin-5-like n=1 Tax=Astyanax mexicanus TaxID=7994 RepID=UPI0020CAEC3E|nr:opsin-5-like [Astyanax mexicanus]